MGRISVSADIDAASTNLVDTDIKENAALEKTLEMEPVTNAVSASFICLGGDERFVDAEYIFVPAPIQKFKYRIRLELKLQR